MNDKVLLSEYVGKEISVLINRGTQSTTNEGISSNELVKGKLVSTGNRFIYFEEHHHNGHKTLELLNLDYVVVLSLA